MADVDRKLAWQLDRDEVHSHTTVESGDYILWEERSGRFQPSAFYGQHKQWGRWPGLRKHRPASVWLVSQRASVLHPIVASLLTYDDHLIDADFLASVLISNPGLFLHTVSAGRTAILSAIVEQHISQAIYSHLLSKTKFYTLDTLLSQPQAQEAILLELRSFLHIILANLGVEAQSVDYLEFQRSADRLEIARQRQQLLRKLDALTLELHINRLEDVQMWQQAKHDFQGYLTAADRAELDVLQASDHGARLLPQLLYE